MIYTTREININGSTATIDEDIYLFKQDSNIELKFILNNVKFTFQTVESTNVIESSNASYFRVKLLNPNKKAINFPIQKDVEIICACDVKNHLLGKNGATYVFGKQKGIYLNQMSEVERGMAHYCMKLKQTFHVNVNEFEGSGAAGGIGSVLLGVMQAKRVSGIDLVVEYSGLKEHLQNADLVITGEGQTDAQTLYGKLPLGIAHLARSYSVPCVCLSGALGLGYQSLYDEGMIGIFILLMFRV